MSKKVHVESRYNMDLLRHAFQYMVAPRFTETLCETIKHVRFFQLEQRRGGYKHIESMPCGHQDAFGDKVDALYFKFAALKIAYKLKRGDATLAQDVFNNMVGRFA